MGLFGTVFHGARALYGLVTEREFDVRKYPKKLWE